MEACCCLGQMMQQRACFHCRDLAAMRYMWMRSTDVTSWCCVGVTWLDAASLLCSLMGKWQPVVQHRAEVHHNPSRQQAVTFRVSAREQVSCVVCLSCRLVCVAEKDVYARALRASLRRGACETSAQVFPPFGTL
jgi:hypothetical protein